MGRINLSALRVRQRAVETFNAKIAFKNRSIPVWTNVMADIPPSQILIRQQPHKHQLTQVRTRTLPGTNKTQQYATIATPPKRRNIKASRVFVPVVIKYEEDELRRQFFSDHPWELARPRIVLESSGNQYADVDWSKGLLQPCVPLSGESVIQRQLWLLQNIPDITVPQSYDIARQEFYTLRRAEETKRRIAIEEAEHVGAVFHKTANQWSLEIENKMVNDWQKWSRAQIMDMMVKSDSVSGDRNNTEEAALEETQDSEEEKAEKQLGTSTEGNGLQRNKQSILSR